AEDGIRDATVTGVQTCALPIYERFLREPRRNLTRDFSRGSAARHFASRAVRQRDLNGVHAAKSFVVETASLLAAANPVKARRRNSGTRDFSVGGIWPGGGEPCGGRRGEQCDVASSAGGTLPYGASASTSWRSRRASSRRGAWRPSRVCSPVGHARLPGHRLGHSR